MKKFIFTFVLFSLFFCNQGIAQFDKGSSALNIGLGVGGYAYDFGTPSISASYEVGVFPIGDGFGVIGLGAFAGIKTFKFNSDIRSTTFGIAPRGTFHFTVIPVENLDVYAALQLLLDFTTFSNGGGSADFDPYPNFIAGARYSFSDNLAVFAELGYSLSYLTAGISLKL